ncbi:unnamed protein product [Pneumocystis jirovecii]|uniref:Uncharacterized protein n=1 Tax=Pneumocystis jirovecii TaxID=42068 RepID=L0PFP8_PNEJI|nr:unnamed protein product [Pneumocystis jirovecii]
MSTFLCKKGTCVADSEGEDDFFSSEAVLFKNGLIFVDTHISQEKMHCEKTDTMSSIVALESSDNPIISYETSILILEESKKDMENKGHSFLKEKNLENDNSKDSSFLSNSNCNSNVNIQRDLPPIMNADGSDDEIQLLPLLKQSNIGVFETTGDGSAIDCREEATPCQNMQVFQLSQQEKSEIKLLSLAACIDTNPLQMNGCKSESNGNGSVFPNDIEFTAGLKDDVFRKKGKKMKRSKTTKDDLKKGGKVKRYSSLGSYHDYMNIVGNTSPIQQEFGNGFSETAFSKDALKLNRCLSSKDSDQHPLYSYGNDYCSVNHNALLDGSFSRIVPNDSETHEFNALQLTNYQENSQLNVDGSLKTPESCKQDSEVLKMKACFSVSRTVEIVEKVLDNVDVNTLQLENGENIVLESKSQQLTPPMETLNTIDIPLTPAATPSALKESVRKSTMTKPYYRVGLSKKSKNRIFALLS